MAGIADLIKEIKKEAQNTRWKSPHSIKSIKQTLVSANKETAADKEKAAEAKLAADAQLTQLTNISDTLYKMYNEKQNVSNEKGSTGYRLAKARQQIIARLRVPQRKEVRQIVRRVAAVWETACV